MPNFQTLFQKLCLILIQQIFKFGFVFIIQNISSVNQLLIHFPLSCLFRIVISLAELMTGVYKLSRSVIKDTSYRMKLSFSYFSLVYLPFQVKILFSVH